jgi:hypothetical protein
MIMQKFLFAFVAAMLALVCATQACAERYFPEQAKRGEMKADTYPSMKIGDQLYRVAPGGRIFNEYNMIIMPTTLKAAPVMYVIDFSGYLSSVWLLTDDEAARHPLPK